MAEKVQADTDSDSSLEGETKSFHDRLSEMPTYTMTLSKLQSLYTNIKERNEYLTSAFNIGESLAGRVTSAAKPAVVAATDVALKVAKPVVGEVNNPAASIDNCASEVLAKFQEKLPFVKQTPEQILESAKSSAKDSANYYYDKVQSLGVTHQAVKQLDNIVSVSDLIVELCFPTDGRDAEDIKELEKLEDEEKGVLSRAKDVKDKACRRGTRKLMTYRPVRATVDLVQFAQHQISKTTSKLLNGTNYTSGESSSDAVISDGNSSKNESQSSVDGCSSPSYIGDDITDGRQLVSGTWDSVYKTSMYIPKKAVELTGEVYISAKEMVFAYSNAKSIQHMSQTIKTMSESYYSNLKHDVQSVDTIKDKAVAFVYVPAQVVSKYVHSNRVVQWILPSQLKAENIQVMGSPADETTN